LITECSRKVLSLRCHASLCCCDSQNACARKVLSRAAGRAAVVIHSECLVLTLRHASSLPL
jgi:hypothetical protein